MVVSSAGVLVFYIFVCELLFHQSHNHKNKRSRDAYWLHRCLGIRCSQMFVCWRLFGIYSYFRSDVSPISDAFHLNCLAMCNCKEPGIQSLIEESGGWTCHLMDGNGSSVTHQGGSSTASRDPQIMFLAGIIALSTRRSCCCCWTWCC